MIRAAFFDVGDTLLRASGGDAAALRSFVRERLVVRFGERAWFDDLLGADLLEEMLVDDATEPLRQRTHEVLARWLDRRAIARDDIDIDELRRLAEVPRTRAAVVAPGARELLIWLKERGVRTGVVSNTLWTGDDDLRADLPTLGLDRLIDVVVTSHSTGFRKPHPAIFWRALAEAEVDAGSAFMVGDEPYADVVGSQRIGMCAIWLRLPPPRPHPVGAPRDLRVAPDAEVRSLSEVRRIVEEWIRR